MSSSKGLYRQIALGVKVLKNGCSLQHGKQVGSLIKCKYRLIYEISLFILKMEVFIFVDQWLFIRILDIR